MPSPLAALATLAARWFGHRRDEDASRSSLAARLASEHGSHVAAAAGRIAAVRMAGFDAQLLRALKTWAARDNEGADLVRLFLLDALVRTDAVVPAAALRAHLHGITEPAAFVLLVRTPRVNELDLLASFRRRDAEAPHDLRWVAEGNLLCSLRTPGFANAVLRGVPWHLRVDVVSPGDREPGDGACLPFPVPLRAVSWQQDFPPLPAYSLHAGPPPAGRFGEVLAAGNVEVAFSRAVAAPGANALQDFGRAADEVEQRWQWLRQLVESTLPAPQQRVVVRHDAEAVMLAAIEHARAVYLAARRDLLAALVAACALSPIEVRGLDKTVAVDVVDRRSTKNGPLPLAADGG